MSMSGVAPGQTHAELEIAPSGGQLPADLRSSAGLTRAFTPATAGVPAAPPRLGLLRQRLGFLLHYGLFITVVVLPCLVASLYLFVLASDRYLSEVKFVVRSAGAESSLGQPGNVSVGMHGLSRAHDDAYVVNEYVTSRDALAWLTEHENLRDVFSRQGADIINRYPNFYTADTREGFYRYFKRMVSSDLDDATGISTVSVEAFSAEDAQRIARGLVHASEALVNKINARSDADAVAIADEDIARAKARVEQLEARLQEYRSRAGFVDVQAENLSALRTITDLSTSLARLEATLRQQRMAMPGSPVTRNLEAQAASLRAEIARRKDAVAGSDSSIASKAGEYGQLNAELSIAKTAWTNAEAYRETARRNAERQHLYLQTVVDANAPDQFTYPRRKLYLLLTFLIAEMIFIIARYIRQYAYEHAP